MVAKGWSSSLLEVALLLVEGTVVSMVVDSLSCKRLQWNARDFSDGNIIHNRKEQEGESDLPHTFIYNFRTVAVTSLILAGLGVQRNLDFFMCLIVYHTSVYNITPGILVMAK